MILNMMGMKVTVWTINMENKIHNHMSQRKNLHLIMMTNQNNLQHKIIMKVTHLMKETSNEYKLKNLTQME